MKLKTLSSKLTIFRKDITRFSPLWALYLIGMMLVFFSAGGSDYYDIFARAVMPDLVGYFGVINLAYAGLCAMMLFGDLFQTRMCYSIHALPQRRENLFLSHLGAGLCFSLIPNLVACVYLMTRLQDYWFLALLWLLSSEIQFLFFFGLAALSAMLTGNRLGMLAVYAVLNFFSPLIYWTVDTIYLPQMEGVILSEEMFSLLCPVVHLFNFNFFTFKSVPSDRKVADFYAYTGLGTGWDYLAVMAVIGIAVLGLAVLLYRRRHLESAGDFVAFRKLSPVICVLLSVCAAVVLAMFGELTGTGYTTWLFVGLVIGYFGSLMLLERRLKVFRVKTFAGLAVLAALSIGSFFVVENDVFNVVRWLPEAGKVESVTVANYNSHNGYYEDMYYINRIAVTLTEQSDIAQIIDAHEDILNRLNNNTANTSHRVVLTYKLKDGRTVKRSYSAPANGLNYSIISSYFYTPENIFGYTDWDRYVSNIQYIIVDDTQIPQALQKTVLEALKTDCEKGYVSTLYAYKDCEYYVNIQVRYPDGTYVYRELGVLSGAENTISLIKSPQVLLGYTDWADFLQNLTEVYVDGYHQLRLDQQEGLMTALRSDCESGNIVDFYYEGAYEITYTYGGVKHWLCVPKTAANTLNWIQTNLE